jgi:hypothetical protein
LERFALSSHSIKLNEEQTKKILLDTQENANLVEIIEEKIKLN